MAASTMEPRVTNPASPSDPIRTSERPCSSLGGSAILMMIGDVGCCWMGSAFLLCSYFQELTVKASSVSVRTATPLAPFG